MNDFAAWDRITAADWSSHGNGGSAPILAGNSSAWVGFHQDQADAACWLGGLGYGDDWCQRYVSPALTYDGSGAISLDFNFFSALEDGYDFVHVIVRVPSLDTEFVLDSFTGLNGTPASPSTYAGTILELEAMAGGEPLDFHLAFELDSDGNTSDQDGGYLTDVGPFAVDNITLNDNLLGSTSKVYWADSGTDKIQRSNPDGSSPQDIITGENVVGVALDVAADRLYWSTGTGLRTASLDGTGPSTIPTDFVPVVNEIELDADGERMFFVGAAQDNWDAGVWRINLDGSGPTPLVTVDGIQGIALDLPDGKIYWSESSRIRRSNLDGSSRETLVSGLTSAGGLDLDLTTRMVYWVDAGTGKIQRANLDGTVVVEDLVSGLIDPIGVGVDSADGKVYWTNQTVIPTIQRANLDGSGVEAIVEAGLLTPGEIAPSVVPVEYGSVNSNFDFEAGDEGFTASACDGIGTFVAVNGVSSYEGADFGCGPEGNVLSLHDDQQEHPDGQHVRLTSPIVDVSFAGPGPKSVFAEIDLFTDLPLYDGVYYKPTWVYFPYTCEVTGAVGWSDPVPTTVAFFSSSPRCDRKRHFATETTDDIVFPEAIPEGAEQVRFVLEVKASCADLGIPPGNCTGESNFSPLIDNVRIGVTSSDIVHVPSFDHPTIQSAIDAAAVAMADTVLLRPGTYTGDGNRDLDFGGRDIVLMSEEGAEVTVIDCEGTPAEYHRGFWFHSGETNLAVVQGVTVTNGLVIEDGGGILIEGGASPTIRECILTENYSNTRGGGIGASDGNLTIVNTIFSTNEAKSEGGGLHFHGSEVSLTGCSFQGNNLLGPSTFFGAGASLNLDGPGSVQVDGCEFTENGGFSSIGSFQEIQGVGLRIMAADAGGMVSVTHSTFVGNGGSSLGQGSSMTPLGMGIYIQTSDIPFEFSNCVVAGNFINDLVPSPPFITGCKGAGLYLEGTGTVSGSTVVANQSGLNDDDVTEFSRGGGIFQTGGALSVENSIVWGNCAVNGHEIYSESSLNLSCCDVEFASNGVWGSYGGADNISGDPFFCGSVPCSENGSVSGDYTLAGDSPCLPDNNACGQQIGALGEACPRVGPDPLTSSFDWPASPLPPCPDSILIGMTVRNVAGETVPDCSVTVLLVSDSGQLDAGQETEVSGVTDVDGMVELEFHCGVGGTGMVHFEISCNSVHLIDSPPSSVTSSCEAALFSGTVETVDGAGDVGAQLAMALDSGDRPHVSYYGNANNGDLKYATRDAGGWSVETIVTGLEDNDDGNVTSIAVDAAGVPHISHYDQTTSTLKYTTKVGGAWETQDVDPMGNPGEFGRATAIALHGGAPRIAYYHVANGGLKYAIKTGGAWEFSSRDVGTVHDIDLAMDNAGRGHILYTTSDYQLRYAVNNGGTWESAEIVSELPERGLGVSIELDASEQPHIAFVGSGIQLYYGVRDAAPWSFERVQCGLADFPSLALDSGGDTWIAFEDGERPGLTIAHQETGTWVREFVVDMGGPHSRSTQVAFALASGDLPQVAFHDATLMELRFAGVAAPPTGVVFTDVTDAVLGGPDTQVNGVFWPDYDDDGDPDLFLTRGGPAILYRNDGGGVLTPATPPGLALNGGNDAAWADYDNDGDLDVYLVVPYQANRLLRNDGNGAFVDVASTPLADASANGAAAWADMDLDGDLDLMLGLPSSSADDDMIFRNEGGDSFTALSLPGPASLYSSDVAWADYDRDGDQDCFIANLGSGRSKLLRNDLGGNFVNVIDPVGSDGLSHSSVQVLRTGSWGDYDNDGLPDLYLGKWSSGTNLLFRNQGDGSFVNTTSSPLGDTGNAAASTWGDVDLDGDLDLFLANWQGEDTLFLNEGGGSFEQMAIGSSGVTDSKSAAMADFDGDGDLDLMVGRVDEEGARLYQNDLSTGSHWLHVDLVGTTSSRTPMGARVRVVSGSLVQERELCDDAGGPGTNSLTLEFGLGTETQIESVTVYWPSGLVQESSNVASDQRMLIVEGSGTSALGGERNVPTHYALHANSPNPFNPSTTIAFDLPKAGSVTLEIFDVTGRRIQTIMQGESLSAGRHERQWKGRDHSGRGVASGIYFYRIAAGGFSETRRMTLIK